MSEGGGSGGSMGRGQIAFEFLVVYSFVIVIFVVLFLLISSERASSINSQSYSTLQLVAQNIAAYIDAAVYAGNGYNASIPLVSSIGSTQYNITISSRGVVIVSSRLGSQITNAYAYSNARNIYVNGTNSIQGTNVIQLTVLKNNGVIRIYNVAGKIYINENPSNISTSLPISLSATVVVKGLAAGFNGANSYLLTSAAAPINNLAKFSITGWFDLMGAPANQVIYSESSSTQGSFALLVNGAGQIRICAWKTSTACTVFSGEQAQDGRWEFFALTFNGVSGGTGTLNVTLQTTTTQKTSWQSESNAGASYAAIGYSAAELVGATDIGNGVPFNGFIANLQIYNTTLTPKNISTMYNEGFTAPPANAANITEWYRLAGDGNDYGGKNVAAYANNIDYSTIEQIGAYGTSSYGTIASPMTIFTVSNGLLGSGGLFLSNYSLADGVPGTAFLDSNGAKGQINLTASEFNGQNGLVGGSSLAAWFPLDAGFGNTIGGFSGLGGSNTVSNPIVLKDTNFYGGYPKWTAVGQNITNFMVANFPGKNNVGYMSYPYISAYNNIISNNSFTVIAWYFTGGSSSDQGILGNEGTQGGPGFQFFLDDATNAPRLYVGSARVGGTNLPTIIGNWIMVAAQYQGNDGIVNFYYNNTLEAQYMRSGLLQSNAPFGSFMRIGDDEWDTNGGETFNGILSNIQLYSTFLNQSQISYIWKQGTTGAPIAGPGLLGWWPLNGGPNDTSSFQNVGTVNGSVNFINSEFSNYSLRGVPRYVLTTNPVNSNSFSVSSANLVIGSQATVVGWIDPTPVQFQTVYNDYFDYGTASSYNTLIVGIRQSGIPFLSNYNNDFTPVKGPVVNWNSWNFIADVMNGQSISIFINGMWENGTLANAPHVLAGPLTIGSGGKVSPRVFNGSITDLQIYNTALTPQQIVELYNQGMAPSARLNLSVS